MRWSSRAGLVVVLWAALGCSSFIEGFKRGIDEADDTHPAIALNDEAIAAMLDGDCDTAARLLDEAEAIADPEQVDIETRATILDNRGLAHKHCGRWSDARRDYEASLAMRREHLPPDHDDLAYGLNNLAGLLYSQGELEQALPLFEQALGIWRAQHGEDDPIVAKGESNLGMTYLGLERLDAAATHLEAALAQRERLLGTHRDTASSLDGVGRLRSAQGRDDEAVELMRRALAMRSELLGPDHPVTGLGHNNLGDLLMVAGRTDEAIVSLTEGLRVLLAHHGPLHPDSGAAAGNLGNALLAAGRADEALPLLRQAHAADVRNYGADSPDAQRDLELIAQAEALAGG